MANKKDSMRQEVRKRGESRFETRDYENGSLRGRRTEAIERDDVLERFQKVYEQEIRRTHRALSAIDDIRNEFYAGLDPRRKQEMADAGIIREDRTAMANLPNRFIHKEYSKTKFYSTPYLDDIEGD
jgi:hypothetical protein